uniref:Uncharacterized protein n=1 Tax=Glossina austeni TaxID=7395 RepID=A0A1A9VYW5_GLOAU
MTSHRSRSILLHTLRFPGLIIISLYLSLSSLVIFSLERWICPYFSSFIHSAKREKPVVMWVDDANVEHNGSNFVNAFLMSKEARNTRLNCCVLVVVFFIEPDGERVCVICLKALSTTHRTHRTGHTLMRKSLKFCCETF